MNLRIDAGWILGIQYSRVPADPALRDWGALHAAVERHAFERFAGEPYYEEAPTRAAALLETIVRLRPFEDYNGIIGAMCAWEYMEQSGTPIAPPPGAMVQLVRDIRTEKATLQVAARLLRDWAA
ncbi:MULTISPECIES: hypothetical protein [unclassified Streptomyces]|uniref:hypothetical protein n=1 Tax=unclassified Streptomyces TaxID=2593676 RepID=UPI001BEB2649|nr:MULTISPECIES: hypothetical protein [unclassified Streptomyces]MBT2405989.1 hypothetical protein [Streptomyces sp. ISL-21]MBT2453890.1 hypothetical protein [Streptomyces sp. ISL-86]MBT2608585.1 hypothetical protein [Streptomyces sp. ISL-87]